MITAKAGGVQATDQTEFSPLIWARVAGFLYLLITALAVFVHFYVPGQLIVPGDAAMTANNIMASGGLFRLAIGSDIILLLSEIVLSVILYVLLRPVSKTLSLLAAVSRLAMTTIHGVNLLNQFMVCFSQPSAIAPVLPRQQISNLKSLRVGCANCLNSASCTQIRLNSAAGGEVGD